MRYETVALGGSTAASLDCYVLDPHLSSTECVRRPAMLILPGGAYLKQAHREGEPVAARFLGMGYSAFILRYSTYVTDVTDDGKPVADPLSHYPVQVIEAMRAMQWLHDHAEELWIDETRIYVLGFSAGAHILCSMCERFDDKVLTGQLEVSAESSILPAAQLLAYPMVSASVLLKKAESAEMHDMLMQAIMGKADPTEEEIARLDLVKGARPEMPPTFIWQTAQDTTVDPLETLDLAHALLKLGVPCEMHLYGEGPHGMGLADRTCCMHEELIDERVATWVGLADSWLKKLDR